ncbi:MAG: cytosol nonspecific dipeptidase [Bacteroidetes bacterium]|nr:MAG: cytosol nonspecific dipeptidase [Bacteroidota bacterium]
MSDISQLQPSLLWQIFDEITQIPRPSKHEEQMVDYLLAFAEKHELEAKRDEVGNVLMRASATPGYEDRKPIILQSHVDMVCEKNADVEHDFMTDPISAYVEDGWVKARGTTLGGDDGIGVAAQLAVLVDPAIPHGPLEALFTVDEEEGLNGALALQEGFFTSSILINLDSEDEGELFIGCAGGRNTYGTFRYHTIGCPANTRTYTLSVTGLRGGHSGDDIHKGYANANILLARLLFRLETEIGISLATVDGGNKHNAISREATATFCINKNKVEAMQERIAALREVLVQEYCATEENITIEIHPADAMSVVMDHDDQTRLIELMIAIPHGVIAMSHEIDGLVETSTNFASIKKQEGNELLITTSQRSSVNSAKNYASGMVTAVLKLAGCEVTHSAGYPGWAPNRYSGILKVTEEAYQRLFGQQPLVRAIHAGLECGLFLEKYPRLDMVSFGPTIRGAHSPDERLDIASTQKFWELLLEVLKSAPQA